MILELLERLSAGEDVDYTAHLKELNQFALAQFTPGRDVYTSRDNLIQQAQKDAEEHGLPLLAYRDILRRFAYSSFPYDAFAEDRQRYVRSALEQYNATRTIRDNKKTTAVVDEHAHAVNVDLSNTLRVLAIDMVEKAKSGHPGLPMGMADVVTVLYRHFLNFNPKEPNWPNRDRFILSAGHGSALLYAMLYLTGYDDMTMQQLQQFRQLHGQAAGHPEYGLASGIETTTGPLGQGLANAVGMAIAERMTNAKNSNISHKTYVVVGDGCLMEGISQEAISTAGHLKLNNLIVLFDDNGISIDGPTSLATSEDHIMRFKACGFITMSVDGHDFDAIHTALHAVQNATAPVFIACKTVIGYGSPNKAGSSSAHGSPLGKEESIITREKLGWHHPPFTIPEDLLNKWRSFADRCSSLYDNHSLPAAKKLDNKKVLEQKNAWALEPYGSEASRKSSEHCINFLHKLVPHIVGGSADLTGSNFTKAGDQEVISADNFSGSYIHWGIREHGMAAMMNGIALYGNFIPYGGTFLVFADYLRPALRLSALMKQQVIYIMTHDSIGVGEDGPTHQPIEHLASLRAIPNLLVMRPCDRIETLECWQIALNRHDGPSLLALSRQSLPQIRTQHSADNLCHKGAYILQEHQGDNIDVTIYASGSEVAIAKAVADRLYDKHGKSVRLVSAVCLDLFAMQPMEDQVSLMCNKSLKVAIEAGCSQGWDRLIGPHGMFFGIDSFGESAPAEQLYKHFGLDADSITQKILQCLNS